MVSSVDVKLEIDMADLEKSHAKEGVPRVCS